MSRKHVLVPFSTFEFAAVLVSMALASQAIAEDPPAKGNIPLVASTTSDASKKVGVPNLPKQERKAGEERSSLSYTDRLENNMMAHATHRLLKLFMDEKDVSSQRMIQEQVMGSFSTGSALTTGKITIDFLPSADRAALDIHFVGQTNVGNNVSQRGSVSIYSKSNTIVDAHKPVYLDGEGIHAGESHAHCSSNIQVDDVDAKRRMVERIAWRRVDRIHGQLEQAVSERVQVYSAKQLDDEADALLVKANKHFCDNVRTPMVEKGGYPVRIQASTTKSHLRMSGLQANATQRGGAGTPEINPQFDFVFAAHESYPENFAESMLGGKTVTDRQFVQLIKLVTGEVPRGLWIHDRTPRWDIVLEKQLPLKTQFEDGRVIATLSIAEAHRDDESIPQPFKFTVTYRPEITPDGPKIVREGTLHFDFGDGQKGAEHRSDIQTFFVKKFTALFDDEIYFDGFVPPAGGTWGKLRQVEPKEWRPEKGWIVLGYQFKETGVKVVAAPR